MLIFYHFLTEENIYTELDKVIGWGHVGFWPFKEKYQVESNKDH